MHKKTFFTAVFCCCQVYFFCVSMLSAGTALEMSLAHELEKDKEWNICDYNYENFEELRRKIKSTFSVGMSLSDFLKLIQKQIGDNTLGVIVTECGRDCTFITDEMKQLFNNISYNFEGNNIFLIGRRATNSYQFPIESGRSISYLHKCQIDNNNANIWEIATHIGDDKCIDRIDLAIFFEDENFISRNIYMDHKYFYGTYYIKKAIKSIIEYTSQDINNFDKYITECGYTISEHTNESGERWQTIFRQKDDTYQRVHESVKKAHSQREVENILFDYMPSFVHYLLFINPDYNYDYTVRVFFDTNGKITKFTVGDTEENVD